MMLTCHVLPKLNPDSTLAQQWESLVQANPASGVMQSLHWAEFKRRQGLRTLHLGIFADDNLIGGALCYAPQEQAGPGLLVLPEGPVLPWEDQSLARAMLKTLIVEAERYAPDYNALALRIEPHIAPPRPRLLRTFRRGPVDLVPNETLYVNLNQSPEAILAQMHPKGRYNIGLAARRGVAVSEDRSPEATYRFHELLQEVAQRDDFFIEPLAFFADLIAELGPPGIARLFFAKHASDILGALLLITYGQRATYLYGGVANQKRNLMAGYALQWAAMLAARAAHCASYDFYGY
ncbi:MAG: peptidoglycan bridge formation glycyltransferase FemA/FemB family protein, partial [Oscillochloris sp.]|nr:peptidoglycan bridge formation glycyltransferase FemA/FemB family protein [Oscillochloris sp.]